MRAGSNLSTSRCLFLLVAIAAAGMAVPVRAHDSRKAPVAAPVAAAPVVAAPGAAVTVADGSAVTFFTQPATRADAAASAPSLGNATLVRARTMSVTPGALAALTRPTDPTMAADAAPVAFNLFEDVTVLATARRYDPTAGGLPTWVGQVAGDPAGRVVLAIDGTSVTGTITANGRDFRIQPLGGMQIVSEVVPGDWTHLHPLTPPRPNWPGRAATPASPVPDTPPAAADRSPSISPTLINGTTTTVPIMVLYTPRALTYVSNPATAIATAIAYTNDAFAASGINVRLNLVRSQQLTYTEPSTACDTVLINLRTNSSITALRATYNPALVATIADVTDCGGIAYQLDDADEYWYWGYSSAVLAARSWASDIFAHEIGHNLGAAHDRYEDDPTFASDKYNYGYIDSTQRWMTIMSYQSSCTSRGFRCTLVPYYSNLTVAYNGRAMGIAAGATTSADGARRINEIAPQVATYTGSVPTIGTGFYWAQGEGGRALEIEQNGRNLFIGFNAYDASGANRWEVALCTLSGDVDNGFGCSGRASLYRGGTTLGGAYAAPSAANDAAYELYIIGPNRVALLYGNRVIYFDRYALGNDATTIYPASGTPQAGWWYNPSQPGVAFFIDPQAQSATSGAANRMFLIGNFYATTGNSVWYNQFGTMTSSSLFEGTLSQTAGGRDFSSSSTGTVTAGSVGALSIAFSSTTTATATLPNGQQMSLQRFNNF